MSTTYRLLKVDTLSNVPISEYTLSKIIDKIKKEKTQLTVFSDFRHGIFNPSSVQKLLKAIPKRNFKAGDSQVASRWGNITEFKNFDLITPNEREARFSLADQDSTVGKLSAMLYDETKCKNLILKLGPRGVFCIDSGSRKRIPFSIGVFVENILDAVGAGDALLAYSSLSLKVSNSLVKASIIGSFAASCACEIEGNKPIGIETIINKISSSVLVNFDLQDYTPKGTRTFIDMSQWLEQGFILREKPFRDALRGYNWEKHTKHFVALGCSTEAILPAWATLLVTSYLQPVTNTIVLGSLQDLEQQLYREMLSTLDLSPFKSKPIMIKGCSDSLIPQDAYILLVQRLQTVAKSLFYGEACSSVPLWKVKK